MKRYTLTIPLHDNGGVERPDFPEFVERELRQGGVAGWTALPGTGVWNGYREPVVVYVIDGDDRLFPTIERVASDFRRYGDQESVYVTAEPVQTFLIPNEEPSFALDAWGDPWVGEDEWVSDAAEKHYG